MSKLSIEGARKPYTVRRSGRGVIVALPDAYRARHHVGIGDEVCMYWDAAGTLYMVPAGGALSFLEKHPGVVLA